MTREAYFDNAKFILIFLVVFGHIIQPYTNDVTGVYTLYTWIYFFSMPAFIFTAGFFAKGSGNLTYILQLAKKLLIPYIIFQLIYSAYYYFLGKSAWGVSVLTPEWSLWFLMSLFSWHIMLIVYRKIPPMLGILLAFGIGIAVGYIDDIGQTLSLSRTFVFFPFFLCGYWLTKEHVMLVKRNSVKIIGTLVLAAMVFVVYWLPEINTGWLLSSKSYSELGFPEIGGLVRIGVYIASIAMAIAVLAWIPNKMYTFTYLGQRTLYVYLLHGFFIQFFRETRILHVNNMLDVFGLALLSLVIVFLLSHRWILGIWQPLIEGKTTVLRKDILQK